MLKTGNLIMALMIGTAAVAAPADPEDFTQLGNARIDMNRFKGVFPAHIKCIAVLTPASIPNEAKIRLGVKMLERAGIKVKVMPHTYDKAPKGKKGIPVARRLADFKAAWNDPEVDMILPTRGGTGAQQLPPILDWKEMRKRKVILMGYSNITCLTGPLLSQKAGYPIQGPNLGSLVSCDDASLKHLKAVLAGESPEPVKLTALREGNFSGKVYAGHLALLDQVQKSPFKVDTAGRVLFIECVRRTERQLKLLFTSLEKGGFFDKCAGVVFCHFTRTFADEESRVAFLKELAAKLKCPVYYGYPYGHLPANRALDFQSTAVIRDGVVTFKK